MNFFFFNSTPRELDSISRALLEIDGSADRHPLAVNVTMEGLWRFGERRTGGTAPTSSLARTAVTNGLQAGLLRLSPHSLPVTTSRASRPSGQDSGPQTSVPLSDGVRSQRLVVTPSVQHAGDSSSCLGKDNEATDSVSPV